MEFPKIFANAAGWVKSVESVRKLCNTDLTHIVVGSFTPDARQGNLGGTSFHVDVDGTSVNSLGLPNPGMDALISMLPTMLAHARVANKELVVSIAGFRADDYVVDLKRLYETGIRTIELNFGCPNIYVDGSQKPIVSLSPYHTDLFLAYVMTQVEVLSLTDMTFWVKVSPTADPILRAETADIICRKHICSAIVCTNTFPNYRPLDYHGKPYLGVSDGFGGMAGTALKPVSPRERRLLRAVCRENSGTWIFDHRMRWHSKLS